MIHCEGDKIQTINESWFMNTTVGNGVDKKFEKINYAKTIKRNWSKPFKELLKIYL